MNRMHTLGTSLVALIALVSITAAFAQTSATTATIADVNTLEMTTGQSITMTPEIGTDGTNGTTSLNYETNDGQTYIIKLDTNTWTFTPIVSGILANAYPVLTVTGATADGGTIGTGTLIDAANAPTPVNVVSGLVSEAGTATVTLGTSITRTVVSGSYDTTLTYTFVGTP